MPSAHHLLAFCVASIVLIEIPGPSLLFALGRALTVGRKEALWSVLGNATGLVGQVAAVAIGLGVVVASSATAFTALKIVGGVYVAYLGIQAIRRRGDAGVALDVGPSEPMSGVRALRTGVLVGVTNPKTVVFFVGFLPQFVDRSHAAAPQLLMLGGIFGVLAVASDACWVLAASRAKEWFARKPQRLTGKDGVAVAGQAVQRDQRLDGRAVPRGDVAERVAVLHLVVAEARRAGGDHPGGEQRDRDPGQHLDDGAAPAAWSAGRLVVLDVVLGFGRSGVRAVHHPSPRVNVP